MNSGLINIQPSVRCPIRSVTTPRAGLGDTLRSARPFDTCTLYTQATSECARSTRRERRLFLFSRLFCSRLFSISLPQLVRIDKLEELAPDLIVLERLPMAEHQKPAYTGAGEGGSAGGILGQSAVFATRTQTKPTHIACGKWWDTTIGV